LKIGEERKMFHPEQYYKDLNKTKNLDGYKWISFDEGLHYFQKELGRATYLHLICEEYQINNGDLEFMAEHQMSLSGERIKKIKSKWRKENR
jgi:hypothetical protein